MKASLLYKFTVNIQHLTMQSHFTEAQSVSIAVVRAGRGDSKGQ